MKVTRYLFALGTTMLVALLGCKGARPIVPPKSLPSGTVQMHFTRKITGPIDLTINGVRVPVEQKKKKARHLTVSGLSEGMHIYYIASYQEVIGPDYGEFEVGPDGGVFQVHFVRKLKAALRNPSSQVSPTPDAVPGLIAVLD